MKLLICLLLSSLLLSRSSAQSPISCAFCVSGLAQINAQILSSADMQMEMGVEASQGCDQIPVKETRETCRTTLNTHFYTFYTNFTGQASNSPMQMCVNMGMC